MLGFDNYIQTQHTTRPFQKSEYQRWFIGNYNECGYQIYWLVCTKNLIPY